MPKQSVKSFQSVAVSTYRNISAALLPAYLVSLSLVDAFNFSGRLTVAILLSALMALDIGVRLVRGSATSPVIGSQFILSASFLGVALVSLLVRLVTQGLGDHTISHMTAYAIVLILLWAVIEWSIKARAEPLARIFAFLTWGTIGAAAFVIVEFCVKNLNGPTLDNLLPRVSPSDYEALYFFGSESVIRARGFAAESGHMALFLLMTLPFVFYYFLHYRGNRTKAISGSLVVLTAIVCTTSAAALADLLVTGIFGAITFGVWLRRRSPRKERRRAATIGASLAGLLVSLIAVLQATSGWPLVLFQGVLNKLLFEDQAPGSRYSRWGEGLRMFRESPLLGQGPGAAANVKGTGIVNLYLDILVDTGAIGLLLFMCILAVAMARIIRISSPVRWVYLFSFVVLVVHYIAISDYWFPWLWILLALVNYSYAQERHGSSRIDRLVDFRVSIFPRAVETGGGHRDQISNVDGVELHGARGTPLGKGNGGRD